MLTKSRSFHYTSFCVHVNRSVCKHISFSHSLRFFRMSHNSDDVRFTYSCKGKMLFYYEEQLNVIFFNESNSKETWLPNSTTSPTLPFTDPVFPHINRFKTTFKYGSRHWSFEWYFVACLVLCRFSGIFVVCLVFVACLVFVWYFITCLIFCLVLCWLSDILPLVWYLVACLIFCCLSGILFEPRHDKTNKMTVRPAKTQISLRIRPVWSESSLCTQ